MKTALVVMPNSTAEDARKAGHFLDMLDYNGIKVVSVGKLHNRKSIPTQCIDIIFDTKNLK
jgi:hypothetical protein